ncbi:MAG: glycosyltransferase [Nitrospiraceae bacterium]|nr:glycosyltransferase [Nitrospiraceae bacterium]
MNVLHIDEQRGWRGGEQQAGYLIRGLAARGHGVFVAGRPDGRFVNAEYGAPSIVRISAPFCTEGDLFTAMKLARAVKRHAIDIIHAHTSHAHMAACLARHLAGRGKVVVSRRVDFPPKRGAINRWKYRQPDKIVCVARYIAGVLRVHGVEEAKLEVVHSGIEPSRFDVDPLPRAGLGVPEGVPLLGTVGALVGHKDHATLIAAMPLVLEALPDLHLVIVGEGGLRRKTEAQIANEKLQDSVHLLGYRTDVPRILRALDAFVFSSKEEGFGGVCSEAMCCGLPVVSTAAGGMPESVLHERTGLLVPIQNPKALAEAVIRVFSDADLARRLGEAGRQQACNELSAERMIEGNIAVYEALLKT